MNKVKPFYIRITDDMTPQMVQDAFDKCVDAGAGAYESIETTQRKHYYQDEHPIDFNYFGVAGNETYLADDSDDFGQRTQEITIDQLDGWLGLESKIEKPNSGQDIYIAQINTLAGVESQRYFVHQYWCNSGHQNQLLELGILFTDKNEAVLKTKSLLGIPHETPEQKAERERLETIDIMIEDFLSQPQRRDIESAVKRVCSTLYDAGYRKQ